MDDNTEPNIEHSNKNNGIQTHIQPVYEVSLVGSPNDENFLNIKQTVLFLGSREDTNVSSNFRDRFNR